MFLRERRQEVFELARELARKEGLSALTMRRLAEEADISVGSIYNMFGTKDDLIMDLIENYWTSSLADIMGDNRLEEGSFIERLDYLYLGFREVSSSFHEDWIRDMAGLNMTNPQVLEKSNKYRGLMAGKIEAMLLQDLDGGNLREDFDLGELASFIFENIMTLLRNDEEDLGFFRQVLEKLLDLN